MGKGIFIISLDFELMWGNMSWTPEGYGKSNISSVREVIDKMLRLFKQFDVHATFATVGLIMHENGDSIDIAPSILPSYDNNNISPFNNEGKLIQINDKEIGLYFGMDIVDKLKEHANIEIGTHTYSHYFCWEEGQTAEQFESDIKKAVEVAHNNSIILNSIVFPKNEVQSDYLEICYKHGISCYRGNALKYYEKPRNKVHRIKQRICRFLDSYINIGGCSAYSKEMIIEQSKECMINLPASRFIRPYSQLFSFAESLKLRRIKKELTQAAKKGLIYHIWWHPHNFGNNINENIHFLKEILIHYKQCEKQYGMKSLNMGETCSFIKQKKG